MEVLFRIAKGLFADKPVGWGYFRNYYRSPSVPPLAGGHWCLSMIFRPPVHFAGQALDTPVYAFDLTFPVPVIEKFLATLAKH